MKKQHHVPVALFVFNRHQQLDRTLKSLKDNGISRLYVFSDGPRDQNDRANIKKVRAMIDAVDWAEITKVYRDKNVGLSESVKNGLNQVFRDYETAIVVEDDVCVAPGFYEFMKASLDRYANDKNVACITGLRYPFDRSGLKDYGYDIFFTHRFSSWGWATWNRFWQEVDFDDDSLKKRLAANNYRAERAGADMSVMINQLSSGELYGGWDVNCAATILLNNQYVAWPTFNMVQNTGLTEGTHAHGETPPWKLEWEKRRLKGGFKFPKSAKENPEILRSFLDFFKVATDSKIKIREGKRSMPMKKPIRSAINKSFGLFGYQVRKAQSLDVANDKSPKHTAPVVVPNKPDPSDYTTTDGPTEVPLQKEAYFIALNNYVKEGDKVLDVGCGIGYGMTILAIKAKEVVGVDIDPKAIKYCKDFVFKRNPKLKELKIYDGYHLPYKDNSFDVVTSVDVIEHVEKYDEFVNELLRVAKRAVLINTPNRRPEYTNPDGSPKNHWHLREWNHNELDKILKKHSRKIDWYHVNGPWEGPFKVTKTVAEDTQTLTPVLIKK